MLDPARSTCVIALPRTGSTVVVDYLTQALHQQNAAELFEFSPVKIRRISQVAHTGQFNRDYVLPIDRDPELRNISHQDYVREFQDEFLKRLQVIADFEQQHSPVVFKIFADKLMLSAQIDLGHLLNRFNVVVLYRQNVWQSLLSEIICDNLYTFHEPDPERLQALKTRVAGLKITADENQFFSRLQHHAFLHLIAQNIRSLTDWHQVLKFEDFAQDAFAQLNHLLGYCVSGRPWANKFISDHEQGIDNIERLRTIYKLYRPALC
jgi:hypothetical protein